MNMLRNTLYRIGLEGWYRKITQNGVQMKRKENTQKHN